MKSGLRRLRAQKTPVPLAPAGAGSGSGAMRMSLVGGTANMDTYLRAYTRNGTVYSIVSLNSEKAASVRWRLYKKQPVDGRRRYTTSDAGSDQRTEIVTHPALKLWNRPNNFFTGFEYREGSNQHWELTGETFWVCDRENALNMPTSMWYINPGRMTPVPDPDEYLIGWIYTGPNGEQIPLRLSEVILEKSPDPTDGYRGSGPVAPVLANLDAQRYATEYQRNLFVNGADTGGVLSCDGELTDPQFEALVKRWREQHQGVARAGAVGVLENGITWQARGVTNKDMEYGNLRLANRDEIREAWRIHKSMLGTSDDVNRANAETADEIYNGTILIPRLNRRRETLNHKLLPMFGDDTVEFDYDSPMVLDKEQENAELTAKANAWATLVGAGADPHDAAEIVGLPDMDMVETATQAPAMPPGWVPEVPAPAGPVDPDEQAATAVAALLRRQVRPFTARALPAGAQNRRR